MIRRPKLLFSRCPVTSATAAAIERLQHKEHGFVADHLGTFRNGGVENVRGTGAGRHPNLRKIYQLDVHLAAPCSPRFHDRT